MDGWIGHQSRNVEDGVRRQVLRRADAVLRARSEARFSELLMDWAADDEGPIPTREQAYADVWEELEVLCAALGALAAVHPGAAFPAELPIAPWLDDGQDWA